MRIAVIGSGIAGLACARLLSREDDVTLFEANDYLGGHTHTHEVEQDGQRHRIDTGFIVHNPVHYPLLTQMFQELGVATQPTAISFSVHNAATGLEYNAGTLSGLFCQRRNLFSWRFLGMVRDLLRFYRTAPALLAQPGPGPTLGDYLREQGYGSAFQHEYLVPMASALVLAPGTSILSMPARYLVQFMASHQMLRMAARPQWRVVQGGSDSYIHAMRKSWTVRERLSCAVSWICRTQGGVVVASAAGIEQFDQVVLACHGDQALALLADSDQRERDILGAFTYQPNETVLHTDATLLPRNRKAWAAWNAYIPRDAGDACTVSYCMNLLQGVQSRESYVVTLNRTGAIDPSKILRRMRYDHPVHTVRSVAAQARKHEIQGKRRTWFAGAYWGWGLHEDGMRSAVDVADAIACRQPAHVQAAVAVEDLP
jgi:predicted NAD/FAD-binding protein